MEWNTMSSPVICRSNEITNPVDWWKGSQSMYPKLSKMARDVLAVPATGAGVEREFSISGRVVTKQRNRLSPTTIRDIMQYKRWVAKYGIVIPEEECRGVLSETEDNEMDYKAEDESFGLEDEGKRLAVFPIGSKIGPRGSKYLKKLRRWQRDSRLGCSMTYDVKTVIEVHCQATSGFASVPNRSDRSVDPSSFWISLKSVRSKFILQSVRSDSISKKSVLRLDRTGPRPN